MHPSTRCRFMAILSWKLLFSRAYNVIMAENVYFIKVCNEVNRVLENYVLRCVESSENIGNERCWKRCFIFEKLHHVGWRPLHKWNATGVLLGESLRFKIGIMVTPKGSLIFGACIGSN